MGMRVDKTRCDDAVGGVDEPLRAAADPADLDYLAGSNSYIGMARRGPGAVDDRPVLDQQVVRHQVLLPGGISWARA